ncbi:hypothetical protein LWI28_003416 [Acer negundo]|uniref:Uncharacterized protein n=1 Tax=Acer negundo TaxID=4023 RepID=A0AAD5J494_ACENE|nr:hypothetical protein LWI28_003416 [Acer negundo]
MAYVFLFSAHTEPLNSKVAKKKPPDPAVSVKRSYVCDDDDGDMFRKQWPLQIQPQSISPQKPKLNQQWPPRNTDHLTSRQQPSSIKGKKRDKSDGKRKRRRLAARRDQAAGRRSREPEPPGVANLVGGCGEVDTYEMTVEIKIMVSSRRLRSG